MNPEVVTAVAEPIAPVVPATEAVDPTPEAAAAELETQSLETFEKQQPRRHRARSQEMPAKEYPRVAELTRKLRETEAERDALKAPAKVEPVAAPVARTVPPPVAAPPSVIAADKDPEPTELADPKTGKPYEDFTKFVTDHARWAARDEMRSAAAAHETRQREETATQEHARLATAWTSNVEFAKTVHKDFEAVAYGPSEIPAGSLVDRWINEHPAGPLVLYSLKKNPTELRAMLALPLFEQTEALSLLSQRLRPRSVAAVSTGAAPVIDTKPVPRPPTPVRTGPMRTEPAVLETDELSLDDFAEATGAMKHRRA